VLTGLDDKATAAQAIRRGAQDYLVKSGLDSDTLVRVLRYAIERKGAEEEIIRLNAHLEQRVALRTAELVALNKELESFSYSVSHDLRAPLRRIDGFTQALEEDYADKVDAVGKQHLERIRLASQRMGQLIDDLINLSRVTRAEMCRRPVDLTAMAETIVTELLAMNPDHHVTWKIAEGLVAQGDPNLLRVVLENLLNNAWKYTRKRSGVRIELGVTVHEGDQAFFVRDNGAGFNMAFAENLFAPFQRFHDDSEFEGTGIGLATVQRIIHRHGGRVWAESEVNQGATFYFTVGAE
jgi:light-regulated signal transduction histidine kinase (bacteriophytochrome)